MYEAPLGSGPQTISASYQKLINTENPRCGIAFPEIKPCERNKQCFHESNAPRSHNCEQFRTPSLATLSSDHIWRTERVKCIKRLTTKHRSKAPRIAFWTNYSSNPEKA
ncbi:hypothetical protein M758_7G056600 [Ceratodon purpureus]|uniref:Uncharacterized protein n=1 Tax=Ceratodon purpureus TaxID=3225 RepID=A0A8T0H6H6_CERPU|nr:hypothetical protein KC19_7G059200 [Ceratodon purpureus]KAG0610322.1 hypothetical protein M758_7G056600 [Ceratodon purpureus]